MCAKDHLRTEWTYAGRTLDLFKYPADPRVLHAADGWDYTGNTFVRNVQGHKLLYVMNRWVQHPIVDTFELKNRIRPATRPDG